MKFHDGTDFNADAVVFNYERWRFTDNPYHFDTQVFEYYEYMWGGFDDDSVITAVTAIDESTVEFTLRDPLAPFLANLAMDMFAISSPAAIEAAGVDYGTPSVGAVGTGPFKFVSWQEGTEIVVKDGYARNFLIPKGLAVIANEPNLKVLDEKKKIKEIQIKKAKKSALELGKLLKKTSCTVSVNTEEDKMFGAVTSIDIVKFYREKGINLDKTNILLEEPIKDLGVYTVNVKLHPEVTVEIKVWVVKE